MACQYKKAGWRLLLVIGAIVVLLLSPFPVRAQGPTIEITAPTDIADWALSPAGTQPKTQAGTLYVTTVESGGRSWSVTASDADTTNTNGYMTKYSGGAYVTGTKLGSAMQVQGSAGTVTLPAGGDVVTGTGTVTNAPYTITFTQSVSWTDSVVSNPDSYRIVVTFTGNIIL